MYNTKIWVPKDRTRNLFKWHEKAANCSAPERTLCPEICSPQFCLGNYPFVRLAGDSTYYVVWLKTLTCHDSARTSQSLTLQNHRPTMFKNCAHKLKYLLWNHEIYVKLAKSTNHEIIKSFNHTKRKTIFLHLLFF